MILDTNAVSALFAGDVALEALLAAEPLHHLPVIVIGEYRFGIGRSARGAELDALLEQLVGESIVLAVDLQTTFHYAIVRENLRRAGRPIPENDVWIAALARQYQQRIVSRDQHFDAVDPSLRVTW